MASNRDEPAMLRSLLFVPGNRADMLEKALGLAPDALVPDLEDSVPPAEKAKARDIVASFLPRLAQAGVAVIPRANPASTSLLEDDLAALVGPDIFGISVGKIGDASELAHVEAHVERLEAEAGIGKGRVRLVPWIETARAVVNAYEICSASPRVVAVAFGAEDFTNDMEIERTEDALEIVYPRQVVGVAARAAGVLALDTPWVSFRDTDGLKRDARAARGYGFRGKFAIHPSQIGPINETFAPTEVELEYARRVISAFEEAEDSGSGATSLDGKMIDIPVVRRARGLLDLASRSVAPRE
ncbi:MAG: CoA ester lyase [SAR202 cluster bacterium]|nr:CoA ester lyase [SAR202 cluster bacterium]